MKTILIPTEDHDAMPAVLETATMMARAFDSYMEGFAVRPSAGTYVTVEPVSSLAISGAYDGESPKQARATFEAFMQRQGIPQAAAGQVAAHLSYGWPMADAADDIFIGSCGRVFDLIVLGRPGRAPENPRMPPLEAALFESGKPVLIVPSQAPKVLGKNVLVAWNGSTEQAHTNAYALELLRRADEVTVLTVEGSFTPRPLRRGGRAPSVPATASRRRRKRSNRTGATPARSFSNRLPARGCDLLVKSAYTQSRLRQMIFGGATRHILANAGLPVLMAH